MARNPLQTGDDSGNPLSLAPWQIGDPTDPMAVAGAQTGVAGVDALGAWLAEQRAKSARMGMWNDQTGMPTRAGLLDAIRQTGTAVALGTGGAPERPGFTAYHGSPHQFDAFDLSKIGTGEGAQAYGHGMYLAENEGVAKSYKGAGPAANAQIDAINAQMSQLAKQMDQYSGGQYGKFNDPKGYELKAQYDALMEQRSNLGHMYEVQVNADPERFLHWDKPLNEQHPDVQAALAKLEPDLYHPSSGDYDPMEPGYMAYNRLGHTRGPAAVSQALKDAGIPGIRYLDQGSRGAGEGTSNSVVFSPEIMEIIRRYGLAGLMAGGGAAATQQQQPNALQAP